MLESYHQDYVRTARAKGLSTWQVVMRHVVPNAAIPIVTVIGLQLGFMLGGVVVVETIFAWPGIGRLALNAVEDRDYTVLQGAVLYLAFTFLVVNLLVDVLYASSTRGRACDERGPDDDRHGRLRGRRGDRGRSRPARRGVVGA